MVSVTARLALPAWQLLCLCLSPSAVVVGAAGRPSLIKEHKGIVVAATVCGCCLLAGQIGPLHMEPGPLVSFVVSPMVSTASCHRQKSGTADFLPFLAIFLQILRPSSFVSPQYSFSPSISFSCLFNLLFLLPFHRAIISFHCVLGSTVPSCLFVFIIYSHRSRGRGKCFFLLYH